MQPYLRGLVALALAAALIALSGSVAQARPDGEKAKPRVVYLTDVNGCADSFVRLLCDGFISAARRTGVEGRIVTPTVRENLVDTLNLVAKQRYDLVIGFGIVGLPEAMGVVAPRHPQVRFAILDRSHEQVPGRPRNVHGVIFRTSEAAYLAGWLAARVEQRRLGRDVVGVVGGARIPAVVDFVIGFTAGVRSASRRTTVLTAYSNDFVDKTKCEAIARSQMARGAGVVFNVAGACGLAALEAAEERRIWGIGVDTDQSFLGPHILTSVIKRFDLGFLALLRRVKAGELPRRGNTVLTLRDGAVGLGKISPKIPSSLRAGVDRLERRIMSGEVRVPGAYPSP